MLDWNAPAREFYESLGARAMEEWVPYRVDGEALATLAAAPGREHEHRYRRQGDARRVLLTVLLGMPCLDEPRGRGGLGVALCGGGAWP